MLNKSLVKALLQILALKSGKRLKRKEMLKEKLLNKYRHKTN